MATFGTVECGGLGDCVRWVCSYEALVKFTGQAHQEASTLAQQAEQFVFERCKDVVRR